MLHVVRQIARTLQTDKVEPRFKYIDGDGLLLLVAWSLSMVVLGLFNSDTDLMRVWLVIGPSAVLFYWFARFKLIPQCRRDGTGFFGYMLLALVSLLLACGLIAGILLLILKKQDLSFGLAFFTLLFNIVITAPASWLVYARKEKRIRDLSQLREELGTTHASLDMLRAQINPHFLFNALNTIYGTALQESAPRTADAAQRLGGMMRFMLEGNLKERIRLHEEIDYIKDYIALQQLRISRHPEVSIDIEVPATVSTHLSIAPMLLIPFIENAFKHGISLISRSSIEIKLFVEENRLSFTVANTVHRRPKYDPESDRHGIGLNNVLERLKLLYPERHQIKIKETPNEFVVNLSLQL
jgi:two-component system, LytTR family, sensor kinase